MSNSDVSTYGSRADRPSTAVAVLGQRTVRYAITLGQNARRVVAQVRAASAAAAISAYSVQTGIPSPFLSAAEIC